MPKLHWTQSNFKLSPCGLREAVLRVSCMDPCLCKELAANKHDSLMKTVAAWSLGDQEKWNELLMLFDIPVRQPTQRQRLRKLAA